jgi:hypothetical protein
MVNPVKTIGRFEIPIGSVLMVERRSGIKSWFWPGYDVTLTSGIKLHLTSAEKAEFDKARQTHEEVMRVMGMIGSMQRANHPVIQG